MISALAYKDNGPDGFNVYLGMAIDPKYNVDGRCEWSPAIYITDKDFNSPPEVYRLKLDSTY